MALLDLLLLVLVMVVTRGAWRVFDGVKEGLSGRAPRVCGTYVIPDRAVPLLDGSQRVYFCSATCRDKYRARTA